MPAVCILFYSILFSPRSSAQSAVAQSLRERVAELEVPCSQEKWTACGVADSCRIRSSSLRGPRWPWRREKTLQTSRQPRAYMPRPRDP